MHIMGKIMAPNGYITKQNANTIAHISNKAIAINGTITKQNAKSTTHPTNTTIPAANPFAYAIKIPSSGLTRLYVSFIIICSSMFLGHCP